MKDYEEGRKQKSAFMYNIFKQKKKEFKGLE
jgi:hypothetical protein